MPSTTGTLCIDFGTSSIRAALGVPGKSRPRALELGEAVRSSIDRASIPSAVFIDAEGSTITFGEGALRKGMKGEKSLLFEISPKRWMTTDPKSLTDSTLIKGSRITRKHLLAGLLAQAFSATTKATGLSKAKLIDLEARIAHPVWSPDWKSELRRTLIEISNMGLHLAGVTDEPISPEALLSAVNAGMRERASFSPVDVEEPVAAALELYAHSHNSREICAVVDVGAGTTDLGIFVSLTPDAQSRSHRRKFIQAAQPRSIFMAGDLIDEEVISLIQSRARNMSSSELQDLRRRRRNIKETLFSNPGWVYEAGVEVTLSELEGQKRIIKMREELSNNFRALIDEASSFIKTFVEATFHSADRINVVFAGGGGNIGFLHGAIQESVRMSNGKNVPITIKPRPPLDRNSPAMVERLAVALGGTTPVYDWPVTQVASIGELKTKWDQPQPDYRPEPLPQGWWREQD